MNRRRSGSLPEMVRDRRCSFARGLSAVTFAERVADLDRGVLVLDPHGPADISLPPDWSADPFEDGNWRFQFHSLRWAQAYKRSFDRTRQDRHLAAYLTILEDWYLRNPWSAPPSDESWGDHSTALRCRVYAACAQAMQSPWPTWLRLALEEHVDVLSGHDLYPSGGNHALNQNVGLFAAASVLGRDDVRQFAIDRTAELLERSVDDEGVTDEQSTEYQVYNHRRYREAAELFRSDGAELPTVFARIDRMPEMIAHATLPNGRDVMIGDACDDPAHSVPDTIAEFAASCGERGPRPTERVRVFRRGYLFARTGWGAGREHRDEAHVSLRFGAPRVPHGHHDAGSVTLFAAGERILGPPGKYAYSWDPFRRYVLSRRAQNSVTFQGVPYGPDGGSELLHVSDDDGVLVASVRDLHHPDVDHVRTIAFDLTLGTLVVIDRFATLDDVRVTAEQRLRLPPTVEAAQHVPGTVRAVRGADDADGLRVTVAQIGDWDDLRIARGETDPLDGWVSLQYGQRQPTPVLVTSVTASRAVLVTTVTCATGTADADASGAAVHHDRGSGHVTVAGRTIEVA